MTHVFIFNNASRAANYGVGTYIRQISEGLSVCPNTTVAFVDMFTDAKEFSLITDKQGLCHYQIPTPPNGRESDTYCRCLFYLLARHIQVESHDRLVFQFNYFHHLQLATLLKGQFPDSRIILTVHYLNWGFELKGNLSRLRKLISKGYEPTDEAERRIIAGFADEQRFLHFADEVFVLSKNTFSILINDYKVSSSKLHLIYNGAGNRLYPRPNNTFTQKKLLFMGRLDEIKGVRFLIAAFEKIAHKHSDTHLMIAGDGDFQPYLSQSRHLQGRVSFLGRIQGNEVQQVYRAAYIGIMPSFHEQCSYTAIEMMRHGIPFVGTDSTGLAEMMDATPWLRIHINEENFNEEEFVSQIADRLDTLLSDEAVYLKASSAVRHLYKERYKTPCMTKAIQTAICISFSRPDYILSADYLPHIDARMKQLVEQHPDIDVDFFGLSGIVVYLWWRLQCLQGEANEEERMSSLLPILEHSIEWLQQVANDTLLPPEMIATLFEMNEKAYSNSIVGLLLSKYCKEKIVLPSDDQIMHNALKIYNCKI